VASPRRFVYILKSITAPGESYVGVTSDVDRRLQAHNDGLSPHTSRYRPWRTLVVIEFEEEEPALKFERYLKTGRPGIRAAPLSADCSARAGRVFEDSITLVNGASPYRAELCSPFVQRAPFCSAGAAENGRRCRVTRRRRSGSRSFAAGGIRVAVVGREQLDVPWCSRPSTS
jgi:predicted GIY-YIG superfamily endonuclease